MDAQSISPMLGILGVMTLGVSDDAHALEKAITAVSTNSYVRPVAFAEPSHALLSELRDLWAECNEDNWDGYGALGLNKVACERTARLVRSLPHNLPLPELSAMPNGDVALDWDFAPRRTITVSVCERPRLAWAAIDGDEELSGTVSFVSEFPNSIHGVIDRLSK